MSAHGITEEILHVKDQGKLGFFICISQNLIKNNYCKEDRHKK